MFSSNSIIFMIIIIIVIIIIIIIIINIIIFMIIILIVIIIIINIIIIYLFAVQNSFLINNRVAGEWRRLDARVTSLKLYVYIFYKYLIVAETSPSHWWVRCSKYICNIKLSPKVLLVHALWW